MLMELCGEEKNETGQLFEVQDANWSKIQSFMVKVSTI